MKNINDYKIVISNNIIIVTSKLKVDLEILIEIKQLFENTTNKFYRYGMYKDLLGYYHGYDFINNKSIYCASLNYAEALRLLKKYIEKNE